VRTRGLLIVACSCLLVATACSANGSNDESEEPMTTTTVPGNAFRTAVEHKDLDALVATFADDIELYSPVLPDPFVGKETVGPLFGILVDTFQDIEILDDFSDENRYVLSFSTRVGSEPLHIVDLLTFDGDGKITEFVVTARPMPGIEALANAVAPHLAEIL
jgi:SnoaL-like domain